jgi:hypothetical protein
MKTLDDLTPEIMAKIPMYKERCTKDLYIGVEAANFNREMSTEYIEKIYELAKFEKPVCIFSEDPKDYERKFRMLAKENYLEVVEKIYNEKNIKKPNLSKIEELEKQLDLMLEDPNVVVDESIKPTSQYLFLCSSYHRVFLTWYKFVQDEFNIDHSNKEILDWLYERANNNILRCHFTKGFVLVLKMPHRIIRNDIGFHCTTDGAIRWPNFKQYFVNGRRMPEDIFNNTLNGNLTFEDFLKIDDEDIKAGIITMIKENKGERGLMDFLGAKVVDEQIIQHSSGYSETVKLWKTTKTFSFLSDIDGNMDQPYAWVEMTCPSSGSVYLVDTSAHFNDAVEAMKFHRPSTIPHEMKYDFSEFNN